MTESVPGRWRPVLLALAAFVILPLLPFALRPAIPIAETLLLVVPALAACALIGWWKGGSPLVALLWIGLAAWMLVSPDGPAAASYGVLARGWVLLLVAGFGVASILTPDQAFLPRALTAVGIAAAGAFALTIVTPNGIDRVSDVAKGELTRRAEVIASTLEQRTSTPEWRELTRRFPAIDESMAQGEAQLRAIPGHAVTVLPALLAVESLVALALAWAVYQRLSPVAIGPALGQLRDFRFNDQLIWGIAVGATIAFLPPFADGRPAGLNLLVFFGALYLVRGVGVLSWVARRRGVATVLIVLTAIAPGLVGLLALGVGVGDTWMDWRSRVPSAT